MIDDLRVVGRWLWRVWRPEPGWLAWILVGSVLSAGLQVGFPWLWQYVIDAIGAGAQPVDIRTLGLWTGVVGVGHAFSYVLLQGARSVMNTKITTWSRSRVLERVADADPEALGAWRAGDLVARLHDDAGDKTAWFLCSGVFRAYEAALVAGGALLAMLLSEPGLAVWLLLPLPFLLGAQALAQRTLSTRHQAVQAAVSTVSDELATTFSALRVVRASSLGPLATARFRTAAASQRDAEISAAVVQNGVQLLYQYGWQITVAGLLLFGGLAVIDGTMSLGRYVTFEGLVASMVWPMFDFGTLVSRLPQAAVALRRLDELLAIPLAPPAGVAAAEGDRLVVRDAAVRAADGAALLDGVGFEVGPGERVAVVGEVGAGKSTLFQLASGLRWPTAGEVSLGGAPLVALGPGALGRVAPVPQDPSMLSGTVRENVLLGRPVPDEVLARSLRVSQLDRDLPRLADGLETRVGERGVTLSGGQRQRVAIARALCGQPAILLLDDATSALDAEVEAAFWEALDRELPSLGVLLSTHRPGTLSRADRIVVLERGRVVQAGRHDALVSDDGPYRTLYGRLRLEAWGNA